MERGIEFMTELLRTADEGQILRRGIRAAIIGRPNAGKSSLLNQLFGHDRAIVSHIAGTTRDTIEKRRTCAGFRWCSLTPPVCARRRTRSKAKASGAVANAGEGGIDFACAGRVRTAARRG